MLKYELNFLKLAVMLAGILCLPFAASAQEEAQDELCGEHTETLNSYRLESVFCNYSAKYSDGEAFEAYAIKRSYSLIGPVERYVLLIRADEEWTLRAVGFQRDYDEKKLVRQIYEVRIEDVPAEDATVIMDHFSDENWAAIEATFPTEIDKICLDGTSLTAYRYDGSTLEELGQNDCYGPSGLTDLADKMARYAIEHDSGLEPFLRSLVK